MMSNNKKDYMLAIRRNNNDYLPLEFNLTQGYNGEDLRTLSGIDEYTTKCENYELINSIIDANIVDSTEKFEEFVIIFHEKNKYRELKEGPIFKKDANILDMEYIAKSIVSLLENKDFINHLYNLKDRFHDQNTLELIYILKNTNLMYSIKCEPIKIIKSLYSNMPYEDRRIIGFIVYSKIKSIQKGHEKKMAYKNAA